MIEWCERNGLDTTRIPDRSDAIVTGAPPPTHQPCPGACGGARLAAHVWHLADLAAGETVRTEPDAGVIHSRSSGDGWVEYVRCVPVDSEPPLNPEWAALFDEVHDTP